MQTSPIDHIKALERFKNNKEGYKVNIAKLYYSL